MRLLALLVLTLAVNLSSCSTGRAPASAGPGPQPSKYDVGWFTDADELGVAKDPACEGIPNEVAIKTATRTFNSLFYAALTRDGKICVRPIRPFPGYDDRWQLVSKTGLPNDPKEKHFDVPKRIIAITGDADELMALSDDLRLYYIRWLKNPKFPGKPGRWNDTIGWPLPEPFYLQRRVLGSTKAADVARDPDSFLRWGIGRRNQIVRVFEDRLGRSHTGGGGLTSYYFLTPDGSEIAYSDSGLPADHSHTQCGPRRGSFVAKGLDVSASTMFVINQRGEMYTRLVDFDTQGSDTMFFEYFYGAQNSDPDAFAIPNDDWLEHPRIPLSGRASITSRITLALTGTGNAGRELRVVGTDEEGRTGYWYKALLSREWRFRPMTSVTVDRARVLDPNAPAGDLPTKDRRFTGRVVVDGRELQAETHDYNLYCSPMTLTVRDGAHEARFRAHLVEEWYHLKRNAPGQDGTPYLTMMTLETLSSPDEIAASPAFRALAERHQRTFAFFAEGTESYLKAASRIGTPVQLELWDPSVGASSIRMAERAALVQDGFQVLARDEGLVIREDLRFTRDTRKLEQLIRLNEEARANLPKLLEKAGDDDRKTPPFITLKGFFLTKLAIGLFKNWNKKLDTISGHVGMLVQKNGKLKTRIALGSARDLEEALALLDQRLAAYRTRLAEIKAGKAVSGWQFYENARELWVEHFAFARQEARVELNGCTATVIDTVPSALFDVDLACGDETARYRVSSLDIRQAFMRASRPGSLDAMARLELRDMTPKFPYKLPDELTGKLEIRDGAYHLGDALKVDWAR